MATGTTDRMSGSEPGGEPGSEPGSEPGGTASRRRRRALQAAGAATAIAVGSALLAAAGPAAAQAWPSRPLTLVVGFPPGGGVDIVARQLAPALEQRLAQRVVVENRPGAAANNAMLHVARSAPDGYTLMMGNLGMLAAKPALYAQLPFDPARDFAPVARVVVTPLVAVVPAALPARTIDEFVRLTKAGGARFNFGSGGTGDVNHLAGELLKSRTGAIMEHVPYKGSAPAHVDLAGGQIQLIVDGENIVQANLRDGRTRALAITADKRSAALPDVPTVAEAGYPELVVYGWQGVLVPAGTPPAIIARLSAVIAESLADPALSEKLAKQGTAPAFLDAAGFRRYIDDEARRWADVIRTAGIKVE